MKTLIKLTFANFKENKKRTLATVTSLILTSFLLFSVSIAFSTYEQYEIDDALSTRGSHHVTFEYVEDFPTSYSLLSEDSQISSFFTLQEIDRLTFEGAYFGSDIIMPVRAFENDFSPYITLVNGAYPKNDEELIISSEVSRLAHLQVNDKVSTYTVCGIFEKSTLSDDFEYKTYIPISYTKSPIEKDNDRSFFYVTYESTSEIYPKIYSTAEQLKTKYYNPNATLLNAYGQTPNENLQKKNRLYLAVILYVLSLFCILIIYNSFSISFQERKKEYGILRSIGASKRQIISLVAFEILFLGLLSIPLSFLLSIEIVSLGLNIIGKLLKVTIPLCIYPTHIVISIFFIIFTLAISSLTPARKASKISPIDAVRRQREYEFKKSKESYPIIKKIFNVEGEIAYKNMKRNGKKFNSSVASLAVSIFLFVLVSTFVNFITPSSNESDYPVDISLQIESPDPIKLKSTIDELASLPSIDHITTYKTTNLYFQSAERKEDFAATGYDISLYGLDRHSYDEYKDKLGLVEDTPILYNVYTVYEEKTKRTTQNEAFDKFVNIDLCERYKQDACYYTFDHLHTTTKNYQNILDNPTILLSVDEYDRLIDEYIAFHIEEEYDTHENFLKYNKNTVQIAIESEKYAALDAEMTDFLNRHTDMNIYYTNYALEEHETRMKVLSLEFVIYSFLAIFATIGITGILNSLNTNLSLRTSEFSVLRSIGLSMRGLHKIVLFENIFLIGKTLAIGLPASLILVLILRMISSIQTDPHVTPNIIPFPWSYIALSILGAVLVVLCVTHFSIKKIEKYNIIDSVRDESI